MLKSGYQQDKLEGKERKKRPKNLIPKKKDRKIQSRRKLLENLIPEKGIGKQDKFKETEKLD